MKQDISRRVEELSRQWGLSVQESRTTNTSLLAFGMRGNQPVVLKVVLDRGGEWSSGTVLAALGISGVCRVLEVTEGAALLERILPGNSLLDLVLTGRDDEATAIVADVIQRMKPTGCPEIATTENWAGGFDRYLDSPDGTVPADLVRTARQVYLDLCASQRHRRLLHGDLHHENILFDADRGWLAIDPKGVIGELEFEIGTVLLNPIAHPALFASRTLVQRRVDIFQRVLQLDNERILRWAFARAVLSAVWSWEDGDPPDNIHVALALAREIQALLRAS